MPLNHKQAEKVPKDLGLNYTWVKPEGKGAKIIIVEKDIEYIPFSNALRDKRGGETILYCNDTFGKFKEICVELSEMKKK